MRLTEESEEENSSQMRLASNYRHVTIGKSGVELPIRDAGLEGMEVGGEM
jgi:hypothetical protein